MTPSGLFSYFGYLISGNRSFTCCGILVSRGLTGSGTSKRLRVGEIVTLESGCNSADFSVNQVRREPDGTMGDEGAGEARTAFGFRASPKNSPADSTVKFGNFDIYCRLLKRFGYSCVIYVRVWLLHDGQSGLH